MGGTANDGKLVNTCAVGIGAGATLTGPTLRSNTGRIVFFSGSGPVRSTGAAMGVRTMAGSALTLAEEELVLFEVGAVKLMKLFVVLAELLLLELASSESDSGPEVSAVDGEVDNPKLN